MIFVHKYELMPRTRLNARVSEAAGGPLAATRSSVRRGALIRVEDGFADIHPWPELGDTPLDGQLALLARGETTGLTRRSLFFAQLDAEARTAGRSLFDGLEIPPSHWLLSGVVQAFQPAPGRAVEIASGSFAVSAAQDDSHTRIPPAFDTVKIKMPRSLDRSLARYRLRLDFNATLTPDAFVRFIDDLDPELRAAIEFVEDPCPYDDATWRVLRERTGIRLALDRREGEAADVLVVKPAIQEVPKDDRELVVTSYMDHPVGQLFAAYVAATQQHEECGRLVRTSHPSGRDVRSPQLDNVRLSDRCGLLTHVVYEPNEFTERLRIDGMRLVPPKGSGIGFDDLLEKLPWRKLA